MEGINLVDIPIYIINFCVTMTLLYILLYKPVSKTLSDRRERVTNIFEEAEMKRNEAEIALQEAKAELDSAGEKARQLSHEAIENAMLDAENILDNAQEEASGTVSRAREQMENERQAALEHAYSETVSLAGVMASQVLSREVTIEDNREIAERFFSGTSDTTENNAEIEP